jgi:hypothetical protein
LKHCTVPLAFLHAKQTPLTNHRLANEPKPAKDEIPHGRALKDQYHSFSVLGRMPITRSSRAREANAAYQPSLGERTETRNG